MWTVASQPQVNRFCTLIYCILHVVIHAGCSVFSCNQMNNHQRQKQTCLHLQVVEDLAVLIIQHGADTIDFLCGLRCQLVWTQVCDAEE